MLGLYVLTHSFILGMSECKKYWWVIYLPVSFLWGLCAFLHDKRKYVKPRKTTNVILVLMEHFTTKLEMYVKPSIFKIGTSRI